MRSLLSSSYIDDLDWLRSHESRSCSIGTAKVRLHRARQLPETDLEADDE